MALDNREIAFFVWLILGIGGAIGMAGDPVHVVQGHEIKLECIDWPRHAKGVHELIFTIATIATDSASEG